MASVTEDKHLIKSSWLSKKSMLKTRAWDVCWQRMKFSSSCFYHLRRLKQIRRLVGKDVTAQLVSVIILPRLYYFNALLAGMPCATIEPFPLQRVQNVAAPLVLNLRLPEHVTPALKQLHWLPVVNRIKFKLCLLMRLIHICRAPQYLANSVLSVTW